MARGDRHMTEYTGFKEIGVSLDGMVATVEMRRPPHNFFDSLLIAEIGEAFERLDADPACRAIVLAAEGRTFCAGADFSKRVDTGRRIPGDEAVRIGLADLLVPQAEVRSAAQALALEIAQSAPLAVLSTRETVRRGLVDAIEAATERELVEQDWLRRTEDFQEGIKAMADRRLPDFQGR